MVTRSVSFEVAQTVQILTRSASEANKFRLPFRVKCLPRWRFGLGFFAVVSLPVTTVSQKYATSKRISEGITGKSLAYASGYKNATQRVVYKNLWSGAYPETDVSRLAGFPASGGRQSPDCDSCNYAI